MPRSPFFPNPPRQPSRVPVRRSAKAWRGALLGAALAAAAGACLGAGAAASLDTGDAQAYDLPAGPLGLTLATFAVKAGIALSFDPALTQGLTSPALSGAHTPRQALSRLLAGSGLDVVAQGGGAHTLRRASAASQVAVPASAPAPANRAAAESVLPEVQVRAEREKESATGPVAGPVAKRSATGTKTDTPLIEVPQSVSVLTADRIRTLGATNTREALAYTPGIDVAPYGSESRYDSWITIRGMDSYSPGYFLDGLPLRNANAFGIWQTENYGTERIEVLRGPTSVLYGQNPPGGLVNIVSKRPTDQRLRELKAEGGSHDHRLVGGDFSGPLDEDGQWLYRFTGLARDARMAQGGMPNDRLYLAPSFTWRPRPGTSLTVLSHYLKVDAGVLVRSWPAQGTLVPTPAGTRLPVSRFIDDSDFNRQRQSQWNLGYLLEHRVDDAWTVRQNLRYGHLRGSIDQMWQNGFVTVNPGDAADPANYRQLQRQAFTSRDRNKSLTVDNQAQARFAAGAWRHQLLAGLDHQRSAFEQLSYFGGDGGVVDIGAPVTRGAVVTLPGAPFADSHTVLSQTGLYVQDQAKLGERWVVTLGARHDTAHSRLDDRLAGAETRTRDRKLTRRAGVVHLDPSGWAPYLSYAESFTPTVMVDPASGRAFKPETGRQYEAGLRYQPPGRSDSYSVAAFDLRRRDFISYDPATNTPRQTGEIAVRGVELEALFKPVRQMNAAVAYAWTPKADVTASDNPAEVGRQNTPVSRHRLSAWGDYRFANGLKLGLGARYTGRNAGYGEAAPAPVPATTVWDAMLGYEIDRWELALNLRNATGKDYFTNCSSSSCYYGDARKAIGTATYRW